MTLESMDRRVVVVGMVPRWTWMIFSHPCLVVLPSVLVPSIQAVVEDPDQVEDGNRVEAKIRLCPMISPWKRLIKGKEW